MVQDVCMAGGCFRRLVAFFRQHHRCTRTGSRQWSFLCLDACFVTDSCFSLGCLCRGCPRQGQMAHSFYPIVNITFNDEWKDGYGSTQIDEKLLVENGLMPLAPDRCRLFCSRAHVLCHGEGKGVPAKHVSRTGWPLRESLLGSADNLRFAWHSLHWWLGTVVLALLSWQMCRIGVLACVVETKGAEHP